MNLRFHSVTSERTVGINIFPSEKIPILNVNISHMFEFLKIFYLDATQLTPPMSNDDENKRPSTAKNRSNNHEPSSSQKEKKSSTTTNQVQYRILQRGQPDESTPMTKKTEVNTSENSTTGKSQRNRRKFSNDINHSISIYI